jgi:hypothetical protein
MPPSDRSLLHLLSSGWAAAQKSTCVRDHNAAAGHSALARYLVELAHEPDRDVVDARREQ